MAARLPRWVAELRSTIKREHGFGWSVRDVHGKVQLTRRFENDTRSSVVLELSWDPSCVTTLLALIKEIRSLMEAQQKSLREAYGLLRGVPSKPSKVDGRRLRGASGPIRRATPVQ